MSQLSVNNSNENDLNSDHCESCGEGGNLLCCDNCPRSFHFECINPPISPEEVNTMKGDWFCNHCRFTKQGGIVVGVAPTAVLYPLFQKLEATNPETFTLPTEIRQAMHDMKLLNGIKYTSDKSMLEELELSHKKKKQKEKPKEDACMVCSLGGTMVTCFLCNRSYHLYCLDPPLLKKPTEPWQCHNHKDPTRVTHVVPDKTFRLDFGTTKKGEKARRGNAKTAVEIKEDSKLTNGQPKGKSPNPSPTLKKHTYSEQEGSTWLAQLAQLAPNETEVLRIQEQIHNLQYEQSKLVKSAMPSTFDLGALPLTAMTTTTPVILSQLTPLFMQFLAFQRLTQVTRQLELLKHQLAKPDEPIIQQEHETEEPLAKRQRRATDNTLAFLAHVSDNYTEAVEEDEAYVPEGESQSPIQPAPAVHEEKEQDQPVTRVDNNNRAPSPIPEVKEKPKKAHGRRQGSAQPKPKKPKAKKRDKEEFEPYQEEEKPEKKKGRPRRNKRNLAKAGLDLEDTTQSIMETAPVDSAVSNVSPPPAGSEVNGRNTVDLSQPPSPKVPSPKPQNLSYEPSPDLLPENLEKPQFLQLHGKLLRDAEFEYPDDGYLNDTPCTTPWTLALTDTKGNIVFKCTDINKLTGYTIGRKPEDDVDFPISKLAQNEDQVKTVSRTHCQIYWHSRQGWSLRNRGRNGTRVEGYCLRTEFMSLRLYPGYTITIGKIALKVMYLPHEH